MLIKEKRFKEGKGRNVKKEVLREWRGSGVQMNEGQPKGYNGGRGKGTKKGKKVLREGIKIKVVTKISKDLMGEMVEDGEL